MRKKQVNYSLIKPDLKRRIITYKLYKLTTYSLNKESVIGEKEHTW